MSEVAKNGLIRSVLGAVPELPDVRNLGIKELRLLIVALGLLLPGCLDGIDDDDSGDDDDTVLDDDDTMDDDDTVDDDDDSTALPPEECDLLITETEGYGEIDWGVTIDNNVSSPIFGHPILIGDVPADGSTAIYVRFIVPTDAPLTIVARLSCTDEEIAAFAFHGKSGDGYAGSFDTSIVSGDWWSYSKGEDYTTSVTDDDGLPGDGTDVTLEAPVAGPPAEGLIFVFPQ
jgi:hypothetical protein